MIKTFLLIVTVATLATAGTAATRQGKAVKTVTQCQKTQYGLKACQVYRSTDKMPVNRHFKKPYCNPAKPGDHGLPVCVPWD